MPDALSAFRSTAARAPHAVAVHYFGTAITFAELDRLSDAFAASLAASGFGEKDRIALYLQNVPQFPVALLAAWKLGGSAVLVNPMNTPRELEYILRDSGASVLLCLEVLHDRAVHAAENVGGVTVITTPGWSFALRPDPTIEEGGSRGTLDMDELCELFHRERLDQYAALSADDLAFITYTSGTTGEPKGAMNTHGNVLASSETYRDWMSLSDADIILGIAPVFHITGIIAHLTLSFLTGASVVLTYRFEPLLALRALREHRPTFATGVITALNALIEHPDATREDFSSLRVVYSGGAPIAPTLVERFFERTGVLLHSIYGLTETTSPSHAMPLGAAPRVDSQSGALSVGVPVFHTESWIEDDRGVRLPVGEPGEIVIRGPQVVPGYWNKPEQTAQSIPEGALHTGDVGFMDADGWFYIVDRKKDMINASGYKVWPREVEDVLCAHTGVHEAAVVGVPDEYRGETVWAFVKARQGHALAVTDLEQHCRENLATYKRPRRLVVLDELPTTASGKLLRRELRTLAQQMLDIEQAEQ